LLKFAEPAKSNFAAKIVAALLGVVRLHIFLGAGHKRYVLRRDDPGAELVRPCDVGTVSVGLQTPQHLDLVTLHEGFPDLCQRVVLLVGKLLVARQYSSSSLADRVRGEVVKLRETLTQIADTLQSVVFVLVVLEEKSVAVLDVAPRLEPVAALVVRILDVFAAPALGFQREVHHPETRVKFARTLVQACHLGKIVTTLKFFVEIVCVEERCLGEVHACVFDL